jgi:hypothetical protein
VKKLKRISIRKDMLFTAILFTLVGGLPGFFLFTAPSASAQGAKDQSLAAQCDEMIKKRRDWDDYAKRRYQEQCLQQGTKPPTGDPAVPENRK